MHHTSKARPTKAGLAVSRAIWRFLHQASLFQQRHRSFRMPDPAVMLVVVSPFLPDEATGERFAGRFPIRGSQTQLLELPADGVIGHAEQPANLPHR